MNEVRIKEYTLTDGENDYHFSAGLDMSPAVAVKMIDLLNAWLNRAGS